MLKMDNFRKAIIEELMTTLKIPNGNINFSTIADEIKEIPDEHLKSFYKAAIIADTYGNGMKAILQAAQEFKPKPLVPIEDPITTEAKRLIAGCESMNRILFDEAQKRGVFFEDFVADCGFTNILDKTKEVLDAVKPYCDYKKLIISINHYQSSIDKINAFESAVKIFIQTDTQTDRRAVSYKNNNIKAITKKVMV